MKQSFKAFTVLVFCIFSSCNKNDVPPPEHSVNLHMEEEVADSFFFDLSGSEQADEELLFQGYLEVFKKQGEVVVLKSNEEVLERMRKSKAEGSGSFSVHQLWQGRVGSFEKKLPVISIDLSIDFSLDHIHQIPQLQWRAIQYIGIETQEITTQRLIQAVNEMLDDYLLKYRMVRHPKKPPVFYLLKDKISWHSSRNLGERYQR